MKSFWKSVTSFARRETTKRAAIGVSIAALMAMAAAIVSVWLLPQSLRLDESQSIWQVTHSFSGMLGVVAQDVHMPFYHILLHGWVLAFGTDVAVVRLPSLIFFLATIPFVYLLARTIVSRKWALFAALAFSLSPFMLWYSSEARMYTMLAFFSVINQYFFTRIVKKQKGWIWYTLSAIMGAYTHYFFIFNLIAQGIFYLFRRSQFAKYTFWRLVGVAAIVIVAIAPWVSYFIAQGAASNTKPLIATPTAVNFFNVFSQFMFGFQTDAVNTIIVSCWPLLVIVAFLTVRRHVKATTPVMYLLGAALLPVLLAFGLSFVVNPFFLSRYMLPAIAPLYIVIVWLMAQYKRWYTPVAAIAFIGMLLFSFYQQVASPLTPVKESYREVAQSITKEATAHDIIIMSAPFTVYPFEYYYDGNAQIRTLPLWDRQDIGSLPAFKEAELPDQVGKLIADHQYAYVVLSYDQGYEEKIRTYFDTHFERVSVRSYSAGLDLYVYRVGYKQIPQ